MVSARLERVSWMVFFLYSWPRWRLPSRAGSVPGSAGDRTFSLIGVGATVIGVLSHKAAPNALAGAVTGIGFIGGGLVFRQSIGDSQVVKGVTTATARFAWAALGAAAGEGQLALAAMSTRWSSSAWSCSTSRPCRY